MTESQILPSLSAGERLVLGDRIFCDDEMGLTWTIAETLPNATMLDRLNRRNESMLRALTMLEEHDESQAEDAERAELHRLEGKLNLALELLAELVRVRGETVGSLIMRFNAEGVCWVAADPQPEGTLLLTEWFVLPAWPVALKLHARVVSGERANGGFRVCARLEGASDSVKDWLEKLVFRRHRRAIAQHRVTRNL